MGTFFRKVGTATARGVRRFAAAVKEGFRKFLVSLKTNSRVIPLAVMLVACAIFTFSLSRYTAACMMQENALPSFYVFLITLMSFMCIAAYVGVKKYDKKAIFPLILTLLQLVIQIVLHLLIINNMRSETQLEENPLVLEGVLARCVSTSYTHIVFLGLSILLILFVPLIQKGFSRLNTTKPDMVIISDEPLEILVDGDADSV